MHIEMRHFSCCVCHLSTLHGVYFSMSVRKFTHSLLLWITPPQQLVQMLRRVDLPVVRVHVLHQIAVLPSWLAEVVTGR